MEKEGWDLTGLATIAVAIATLVLAYLTYKASLDTREAVEAASRQASALEEANKVQSQVAELMLRPWLGIDVGRANPNMNIPLSPWGLLLFNGGERPAFNVELSYDLVDESQDGPLMADYDKLTCKIDCNELILPRGNPHAYPLFAELTSDQHKYLLIKAKYKGDSTKTYENDVCLTMRSPDPRPTSCGKGNYIR